MRFVGNYINIRIRFWYLILVKKTSKIHNKIKISYQSEVVDVIFQVLQGFYQENVCCVI